MLAILNFNEEYICSTNGTPQEGGKLQPVYVIFFFFFPDKQMKSLDKKQSHFYLVRGGSLILY